MCSRCCLSFERGSNDLTDDVKEQLGVESFVFGVAAAEH
jgi:hypothetical protein